MSFVKCDKDDEEVAQLSQRNRATHVLLLFTTLLKLRFELAIG